MAHPSQNHPSSSPNFDTYGGSGHATAGQHTPRDASGAYEHQSAAQFRHVNGGSGGAWVTLPPGSASSGTSFHRGNPPPHTFNPQQAAATAAAQAAAGQSFDLYHYQSSSSASRDYSGTTPFLPSLVHSQKRAALGEFALSSRYSHTSSIHQQTHTTSAAAVVAAVCDSPLRASLLLPPPPPPLSQRSYTYPQQQQLLHHQHPYYTPPKEYYYPYGMPGSTIPENQNGTGASPTDAQNGGAGLEGMRKSPPRARLTEQEKKNNHIASEQKRRNAIRDGFDRLTELIPGCEGQGRSEGMVLNKCELQKLISLG